jgi:hypothetical protein
MAGGIRTCLLVVLAAAAVAVSLTSTAGAAPGSCADAVLEDWGDGRIDGVYDGSCYLEAIEILPEDVRAYTSAADDIMRALQASNPARSSQSPLPTSLASAGAVSGDSARTIPGAIVVLAAVAASVLLAGSAGVVLRRVRSRP